MNNLKKTEKLMALTLRNTNAAYAEAYKDMLNVFCFKDKIEHTNHCSILKLLYDVKKRRYTYVRIASIVGTSDNALRRYRKLYAEWFKYYLELNLNKELAC